MDSILLKILDWLGVVLKHPVFRKAAWDLIHSHLEKYLSKEWLEIVHLAFDGLLDEAVKALEKAKDAIVKACNSHIGLMEEIRKLSEECHCETLIDTLVGALIGALVGWLISALGGVPIGVMVVAGLVVGTLGALSYRLLYVGAII